MYSHPQGGRFVPNVAPIPAQSYVYQSPPEVHPGLQHVQNAPPQTLNHRVSAYTQPQTTISISSAAGYHPSPSTLPGPLPTQYVTPTETLHPIQTQDASVKIEKSTEDSAIIYARNQPTIISKELNQAHQAAASSQQVTMVIQEEQLGRQRAELDSQLSRQQATKLLLQQQQAQNQQILATQEMTVAAHVQIEQHSQLEREQKEREIQRQKVIEDHQKQKNSNRIFSNSTKNLTDVAKLDSMHSLNKKNSPHNVSTSSTVCSSPAEHGFRKIAGIQIKSIIVIGFFVQIF